MIVWSALLALLVGWELTGLAFGSRGWPTLSGIGRFFMGLPAGRWALYAGWIWLGWDFLPVSGGAPRPPGRARVRRVLRVLIVGAVLGYAWWAAFLRSALRWIDVLVPAAVLLGVALFGHLRRGLPMPVVYGRVRAWIERQWRRVPR